MITGAHTIIYSTNPEADKEFFKSVLNLTHVDVGRGWLIFGLPPSELAVHPSEESTAHELYLMTDNVQKFTEERQNIKLIAARFRTRVGVSSLN